MNKELPEKVHGVLREAKKFIFGQDELLEGILAALVCEGHLLIEGMPGLGKTMSVSIMGQLCDLNFKRIQFTPDLLPSDLIGTMVFGQSTEEFKTKFGPIFTQILLADEINRAPAKVQSALLEAMAERQVTIGEESHKLKNPFVVLATQNPIDQEGTYALPEAQLDRFMMKIRVDYPDYESEKKILDLGKLGKEPLEPLLYSDDLLVIKEEMESIYVDEKIKDLIIRIVQGTRPTSPLFPKEFQGAVLAGASPRASLWFYNLCRFKAFLEGADFVSPDHILSYAPGILGHRVILSYEAQVDHLSSTSLVLKMCQSFV